MKKFYPVIILGITLCYSVSAQNGPAGIGNPDGSGGQPENIIWLDASSLTLTNGDNVGTWIDISNSQSFINTTGSPNPPEFATGVVNGLPVVRFDGANSERLVLNPVANMATDEISVIIVMRENSIESSGSGILSYATGSGGASNAYLLLNNSSGILKTYVNNSNSGSGDISGGFKIVASHWSAAAGRVIQSIDGSQVSSTSNSSATITAGGSFVIGGEQDAVDGSYASNQDLDGDIAEIIIFSNELGDAEKTIIENYLSEKYAISISNDFFGTHAAYTVGYNVDLRGIGIGDDLEKVPMSGWSDAFQLEETNNSLDAANEYLITAHDNTAHADGQTGDITVDPGILDSHWARSWYIETSGSVTAQLKFDFGTAGLSFTGNAGDYVLLYRASTSDNYTRLPADNYFVENGDQLVVDLSNAALPTGYYTIGEGEQITTSSWYSYQSGDWNDPLTWTTVSDGSTRVPISGGVPQPGDNVIILSGRTVTMDSDDNDAINLTVNGELDIANTSGHNYFNILGNGIISIAGDGSQNDNFPSGSTTVFADSIVGGTVEIVGAGINLDQDRIYNNVIINLGNSSSIATLLADYQLNGDLTIDNGIFRINDNASTLSKNISVYGDVQVNSTGEINTGTADARHEFNFYGNFINGGVAEFTNRTAANYNNEASDGMVDANFLNDNSDQVIDCNGVTNFYRIEIDKGDNQTYILDINATSATNFNLFGPADYNHGSSAQLSTNNNALGLLNGTVRLNNNVNIPVLNNTGNYNINEGARIWVNGGYLEKPGGTAIVPYGTIQLSAGTINAPINSGITTRENGNIVVSGGTMTVNQIRTSVNGPQNIGGYTQSGGLVNVTGGNVNQDYYSFSLTYPGNTFNMSGGTLHVGGADNFNDHTSGTSGQVHGGSIFINSDPGNISVTGGTVIMEINNDRNFKLTSRAPFWNVIMRKTGGSASEIDLDTGTSGDNGVGKYETITTPELVALHDLTVESGVIFDHNGYDVTIGGDFSISASAAQSGNNKGYIYSSSKPNTITFNGTDNSTLYVGHTSGDGYELFLANVVIDKPTGKSVTLIGDPAKEAANVSTLYHSRLVQITGDFELLSGTFDQGKHSIRLFGSVFISSDGILGVYEDGVTETNANIVFRGDGLTVDTEEGAQIGNFKMDVDNASNHEISFTSDVHIVRMGYTDGKINMGTYNVTIDYLHDNYTTNILSINDPQINNSGGAFYFAGNESDGGLTLYVNASTPDATVFGFPIGISGKYTPVELAISDVSDDGYITINPVQGELATTDPSGGDLLDYYWHVNHSGFSGLPTVDELQFNYIQADVIGNESNYVAGKVLSEIPFTRNYEDDGIPENEGVDTGNNTITFNGNSDTGFTLENADYTAGETTRFIGAPQVFYNTNNGRDNWNNGSKWTTNTDGTDDGVNEYPQEGDIALLYNYGSSGQNSWVNANVDISVARVEFSDAGGGWLPRLWVTKNDAILDLGPVSGTGDIYLEVTSANQPSFSALTDIKDFASQENSVFTYKIDNNSVVTLPSQFSEYPRVRIEAGGGSDDNRVLETSVPITINRDVRMDRGPKFRINHDVTIKDDLRVTWQANNRTSVEFGDSQEVTLTVEGDLRLEDGSGSGSARILVKNNIQNSYIHRLRVGGNIEIEDLNIGQSTFDLYNGVAPNNNAVIEFFGKGNHTVTNASTLLPEFYRVVVNKGSDVTNSIQFDSDFNVAGTTSGSDKAIELQNGSLILNNGDIEVDLTTGGGDFEIPSSAGLVLTQGIANVSGDDTGIALDGNLTINGGTLNMDDAVGNGNNFIQYSASGNALLEISSGTLIVGSQIRPITSAETGVLRYIQTGGDVRIGTRAAPEGTRGMLQIYNPGSEFTHTGGNLTIERHQNSPSIAALYLDPDISDVSGSTITIFNANTPSGQNDFGINSVIALDNLIVNGDNSPTAYIRTNHLMITSQLTINSGATFNGNTKTLTVGGDWLNDGVYNGQNNETVFNSTATQQLSGSGVNNFFRLTKAEIGTLDLTSAIDIDGLFTISGGILNDNGFTINVNADAVIDATHNSAGGNGLVFAGSVNQELRRSTAGTGNLGIITINNPSGLTVPDGNGYDFNINGGLRLENGVFNIGGSLIMLGVSAEIIDVNPFGVSNMVQTNSSFVDSGVGKQFAAGYNQDFIFPVGQAYYTPVSFGFGSGTFGSTTGSLIVRPADEYHPTINDGTDVLATGDINNVLQYYWTVEASGVTSLNADMSLKYDQVQVLEDEPGADYEENDYIAARILSFNNPGNDINKFDETFVDETNNIITFNFNNSGSNGISGDYFAGLDEAIPDNVVTYIADNGGGNVDQNSSYSVATPLPTDGTPPSGAIIRIPAGNTIVLNEDNIRLYRTIIEDGGILEVDNTTNHRLGDLQGTGTLRIISDGINANLPAFSGDFLSCSGGGIEYGGTGDYSVLPGITSVRSLSFIGSGDRNFPNNNVTVCEDMTVDGPIVNSNNGDRILIMGGFDLLNGTLYPPIDDQFIVEGDANINGGFLMGRNKGGSLFIGDLTVDGGLLNGGSSSYVLRLYKNLDLASGTFESGTGNARVIFYSRVTDNYNSEITGDFTGSNSFSNLEINKNNLGHHVFLNNNIEVTGKLELIDGLILTDGNNVILGPSATVTPSIGKSNSYIANGRVLKTLSSAGASFDFPIGSDTQWRPVSVNNVSTGGLTWEAEYIPGNAVYDPLVDNLTPTNPGQIETISDIEHWKIADGNPGPGSVTATVGLSWGAESDVSASSSEREELQVMKWNDGISSWDNLGGTNFNSGHTVNAGRFVATSSNSFSEQIYTLGSASSVNPLPVTLTNFEGEIIGGSVKLTWETTSEINNDYFEIEHSADGINFELLARVSGAGTTSEQKSYVLYHEQPASGYNFYKLRQVDFDGQSAYEGGLVSVYVEGKNESLSMTPFPNPTMQQNVKIKLTAKEGQALVEMVDIFGSSIYSEVVYTDQLINNEYKLNIHHKLKPGIYLIKVQQGIEAVTKRVMIKE